MLTRVQRMISGNEFHPARNAAVFSYDDLLSAGSHIKSVIVVAIGVAADRNTWRHLRR